MKKSVTKKAYMCGVDFQHELNHPCMTPVYSTLKTIKQHRACINECGIVEVEIKVKRWVKKQDFKTFNKKLLKGN